MKRVLTLLLSIIMLAGSLPFYAVSTEALFEGEDKINIVLDPGHGGYNIGTATASQIAEKNYTYTLSCMIRDLLIANGNFNVYLTRTGDYDLELYQRAEIANKYNADILISIHFDGNPVKSMRGTTAYTSVFDQYAAVSLASSITSNISSATGLANNGVKRRKDNAGYYWNSEKQWDCQDSSLGVLSDYYGIPTWCAKFGIPSIIVEHGFFSNAADAAIVTAPGALEKIAKAEADAIIAYYTNHIHVYANSKRDFPSNCMYTGKQSEHCYVCGHRRNVSSLAPAADNHYWVTKEYSAASCGKDGKIVRECRITQNLVDKGWEGDIHMSTEIIPAPNDHTFELKSEVAPTHTVDGYRQYKCKTCTFTFKDIIKAEGHTYEYLSYKEPTCTQTGGNTYKCKVCAHEYTEKEPAKGHSYKVTETVDPTCTETGYKKSICTACNIETVEDFAPLGHLLPEYSIVEPTCEQDGYKKGSCVRCATKIDEVIEKKGHTMTVTEDVAPTCEKDGYTTLSCANCDHKETKTVPAVAHDFKETLVLSPTCIKDGRSALVCTACGHTENKTLEATGHEKGTDGTITLEASLFSNGICQYTCKNGCGKIYKEEIPATLEKSTRIIILAVIGFVIAAILALTVLILIKKAKNSEEKEKGEPSDAAAPVVCEEQAKSDDETTECEEAEAEAEAKTETEAEAEAEANTETEAEAETVTEETKA